MSNSAHPYLPSAGSTGDKRQFLKLSNLPPGGHARCAGAGVWDQIGDALPPDMMLRCR